MLSYGAHLDMAAGTAVRFEPGERKTVPVVEFGGRKWLSGGSGLAVGHIKESKREDVLAGVQRRGFSHQEQEHVKEAPVPEMDREVVSSTTSEKKEVDCGTYSTHRCSVRLPVIESD